MNTEGVILAGKLRARSLLKLLLHRLRINYRT